MRLAAVFFLALVIIAISVLVSVQREPFGTSPGTLVQLATSHVPSSPYEVEQTLAEEQARIQRDLVAMTGSD